MTIAVVISLVGTGLAAFLALFGAGVAWGTSKASFESASLRIAKLEEERSASNAEVLRTEISGLKAYLESKFDDFDRRIDRLER